MKAATVQRVVTEKRVGFALVLTTCIAAMVLWTIAVFPLNARLTSTRARATVATGNLAAAQARLVQARNQRQDRNRVEQELATFYDDVLPRGLPLARSVTYARLSELALEHRLVMERRTVTLEEEHDEAGELASLETTMILTGDWTNIRHFMHALEGAPEFMVIEGIVLNQSDGQGTTLGLALSVATYYRNADTI